MKFILKKFQKLILNSDHNVDIIIINKIITKILMQQPASFNLIS